MLPTTRITRLAWLLASLLLSGSLSAMGGETLELRVRSRAADPHHPGKYEVRSRVVQWDTAKTALVVCDMWDQHWCRGATRRVAEMAPRMNEVIAAARQKGVLIVHAPSGCMEAYADTPMRNRAQSAPVVATDVPLQPWCRLDPDREPALPINDSDGGCDCQPRCVPGSPWRRQIDTIEIKEQDAITDSAEAFYLMRQLGIENFIVLGVHVNMCVLGRPFSIRQMVYQGQQVVLMRDMTDSMYNSRQPPRVSHLRGTELVIEHIEQHWCPTITSTALTEKAEFHFSEDSRPLVAFMVNDNHYDARSSLLNYADQLQRSGRYRTSFIDAQAGRGFVGTDLLQTADLLVVYARREPISERQKQDVQNYLRAGKPLIALRTASHAFSPRGSLAQGMTTWDEFDSQVLGGSYHGHLQDGSRIALAAGAEHPVLANLGQRAWTSDCSLYLVSPVDSRAEVLLVGSKDEQQEPVAWTRQFGKSRVFYTSLGSQADFQMPVFRRLLNRAIDWALSP